LPGEPRLIGAFFLSLVVAVLATRLAIAVARRFAFYDQPSDLAYKIHLAPTPYLGGAAVAVACVAAAVVFANDLSHFSPALLLGVMMWLTGTADDHHPIPAKYRLAIESAAAAVLWTAGLGWSLFTSDVANLLATIIWVVSVVNIVNVLDNMDGVIIGVTCASATGVAALAVISDAFAPAVLSLALLGACLGFLPYNVSKPARIFAGDGGTMFIGFVLATALMALPRTSGGWSGLIPVALLVGIPAFNAALVTVARLRRRVSLLTGGQDSCTHWLHARLRSARRVALTLTIAQATLAGVAVLLNKTSTSVTATSVVVTVCLIAAFGLIVLIESSRATAAPMSLRGHEIGPSVGARVLPELEQSRVRRVSSTRR
jgi:UDP-GlcNAc:undecaprenyl-phosphate/decaprenyl-phosphate GlcNAc-1-phosphate transferase